MHLGRTLAVVRAEPLDAPATLPRPDAGRTPHDVPETHTTTARAGTTVRETAGSEPAVAAVGRSS